MKSMEEETKIVAIIGGYILLAVLLIAGAITYCSLRGASHDEEMAKAGYEQSSIVGQSGTYWTRKGDRIATP